MVKRWATRSDSTSSPGTRFLTSVHGRQPTFTSALAHPRVPQFVAALPALWIVLGGVPALAAVVDRPDQHATTHSASGDAAGSRAREAGLPSSLRSPLQQQEQSLPSWAFYPPPSSAALLATGLAHATASAPSPDLEVVAGIDMDIGATAGHPWRALGLKAREWIAAQGVVDMLHYSMFCLALGAFGLLFYGNTIRRRMKADLSARAQPSGPTSRTVTLSRSVRR